MVEAFSFAFFGTFLLLALFLLLLLHFSQAAICCVAAVSALISMAQMKFEHEAVMGRHPPALRRLQFRHCGPNATVGQSRQGFGGSLTGNRGLDHASTGKTNHVRDDRIDFDVGVLQRLLDALRVAAALAHKLLASAQQIAHLLGRLIRHPSTPVGAGYAGPDQSVRNQIRQPGGIIDIRFAPRQVLDVRRVPPQRRSGCPLGIAGDPGVGQDRREFTVGQVVPDGLPAKPNVGGRLQSHLRVRSRQNLKPHRRQAERQMDGSPPLLYA